MNKSIIISNYKPIKYHDEQNNRLPKIISIYDVKKIKQCFFSIHDGNIHYTKRNYKNKLQFIIQCSMNINYKFTTQCDFSRRIYIRRHILLSVKQEKIRHKIPYVSSTY